MKVIIPSSGRAEQLVTASLKFFPNAIVCVGDDEEDTYRQAGVQNLLPHPASVRGIAPLRQWILDTIPDEVVVMADDDITRCAALVGFNKRWVTDPLQIAQILEVTAQCAKDAGAAVFGFNQAPDVRKFMPQKPFALSAWVGSVIGFVGRSVRFDTSLLLRADVDFCLQSLARQRIVWQDMRFSFVHGCFKGTGGNAGQRSAARHARELAYLQRKWGPYLSVKKGKGVVHLKTQVPR